MTAKRKAGRKGILTHELSEQLCAYIRAGLTKKGACDAMMIGESTFYQWLQRGEQDKEAGKNNVYVEFAESLGKAEAAFKLAHIKNIKTAADQGSWQASAWMLERVYRDEYGRNADAKVELTGKDSGPVEVESAVKIYLPSNGRD